MKKEFIIERQGKQFVLYAGLLEEAHQQGLKEISTSLMQVPSAENGEVAICQATVETEKGRFMGLGDASPANTSPLMRLHLIRLAETRAKARALRDAVNVGVAALEELADDDAPAAHGHERAPAEAYAPAGASRLSPVAEVRPSSAGDPDRFGEPAELPGAAAGGMARALGGRSATEKQQKAIYAIAQGSLNMTRAEVDAKCHDIYGYPPQELSRWEASQFIDLLKQDKVA
jgi:hypothetical protein